MNLLQWMAHIVSVVGLLLFSGCDVAGPTYTDCYDLIPNAIEKLVFDDVGFAANLCF